MGTANNWRNVNGSGDRTCPCGTWKKHWENFSNHSWPDKCAIKECNSKPILGAHVYHLDVSGEKIIPACNECNQLVGKFTLKPETKFAAANTSETCEKSD
jgi:hypothetical protein